MIGAPRDERWLTFEVGDTAFAIPILEVFEVSEVGRIGPVPSLPSSVGGVMHYHGDALPIVHPALLLDVAADPAPEPEHVVVLADAGGEAPRLGIPVDRVLGLTDAAAPDACGAGDARMPLDGRITAILDAERLCERAAGLVARAGVIDSNDSEHGGGT